MRAHAVAGAAVLVVGAGIIAIAGARLAGLLESSLINGLALKAEDMREPSRMLTAAAQVAWPGMMILAPFLLLLAAVGLAADLLVGGWVVSAKPVTPDFNRINPIKGFGRLFSHAALAEIVKALIKFVVVGAIAAWLMRSWLADFLHLAAETWPYAPRHVANLATKAFLILAVSLAVVTLFEVPYQVWQFRDQFKMSREEIKDELREQEGSPQTRRRKGHRPYRAAYSRSGRRKRGAGRRGAATGALDQSLRRSWRRNTHGALWRRCRSARLRLSPEVGARRRQPGAAAAGGWPL